jgi:tetratricopeptide (TPR) repeat protein
MVRRHDRAGGTGVSKGSELDRPLVRLNTGMTTNKDTHRPFGLLLPALLLGVSLGLYPQPAGAQNPPVDLQKQRELSRYYTTGYKYFEIQDYAGAIPALKRYTELDTTNVDAWYYLAICYRETKQYPEAIAAFEALNRLEESPETWQNLAFMWNELGEKEKVIAAYERIVELRPDEPEFREYLRSLYLQGGDDRKLLALLQKWVEEDPDDPLKHAQIAELQRRLGDREAQAAALEGAVRANPNNTGTLLRLARLYEDLNRVEEAARTWERLTQADPANADAWRMLGRARRRLGDPEGSAAAFRRAVEAGIGDVRIFSDLAETLIDLRRFDEAVHQVELAIRRDPKDGYAYVTWGNILRAKGFARFEADSTLTFDDKMMLEQAIEKYRKGIESGTLSAEVRDWAERQVVALEPYRPTTAEKFMNRARTIPPPPRRTPR